MAALVMRSRMIAVLLLGVLLPVAGNLVVREFFGDRQWDNIPLHAVVEALGSFAALSLATILIVLNRSSEGSPESTWIASALIGMGVLDGLHAVLLPGTCFVWLHSLATLAGGAFFALVWLPAGVARQPWARALPLKVAVVAVLAGAYSVAFPDDLPAMVHRGVFTGTATALNLLGGGLFLVAAARLVIQYGKQGGFDRLLYTGLCLLFGSAGLLFDYSALWDGPWWVWHMLRLMAYVAVLVYMFAIFRRTGSELKALNESLELRVLERTRDLESENAERKRAEESLIEQARAIAEGTNVLAASVSEILTSTSQLASSAMETATSVSETTTTVMEVRQTAQLSSEKAGEVADSAKGVTRTSQAGLEAMDQAMEGMDQIRLQMEAIAGSTVRLSEQSQVIGEIISTVDGLAGQSNLLAVNAAIEAARAGEEGRGFAVVAEEIKSLAEQSKQATGQVRTILNDIQKATTGAVMAAEQGSKAVEAGADLSGKTREAVVALTESVSEAAQASAQIAASSREQMAGVDQVASAMENIKAASEQNAASMQQVEGSARSLDDLGQRLKGLVAKPEA